jgi:hypothetical protein
MSDMSDEIGLASDQFVAATEGLGMLLFGDEGPCHRLVEAACGKSTACLSSADLTRRQNLPGDCAQAGVAALPESGPGRRCGRNLFHEIGLALDVRTPARCGDLDGIAGCR